MRWIIGDTESGSGATKQVHILVKPTRPELTTNLVINTDRRTYHMELRSTEKTYMASVSWQYPQDQLIALRRQNSQAEAQQPWPAASISPRQFPLRRDRDRAPWRPLRAFDDGRQVFIEFPRGIGQGEMPPLFVVGPEGDTSELVNYRVRGNYMIVDRCSPPPNCASVQARTRNVSASPGPTGDLRREHRNRSRKARRPEAGYG